MPVGSVTPRRCFSRDAVYAVPLPGDVETAPRDVTTGSAALLDALRRRADGGPCGTSPSSASPTAPTPSSRERCAIPRVGRSRPTCAASAPVPTVSSTGSSPSPAPVPAILSRPTSTTSIEPADASAVVRDYFADLDGGRFAAAAARFSADVLYSHPPYQHTGIDDPGRIEFRGRPALLAAFDRRGKAGVRPRRHHVDPARSSLHVRRSRARAPRRRDRQLHLQPVTGRRRHDPPVRQLLLRTGDPAAGVTTPHRRRHRRSGQAVRASALTHCRWMFIILMMFYLVGRLSDDGTDAGGSGPGDGDLRLRARRRRRSSPTGEPMCSRSSIRCWAIPVGPRRRGACPAEVNGVSHLWEVTNRGKRAIALDARDARGSRRS